MFKNLLGQLLMKMFYGAAGAIGAGAILPDRGAFDDPQLVALIAGVAGVVGVLKRLVTFDHAKAEGFPK